MSEFIYAGLTSQSIDVMIYDSSSTTGAGLSGLVYNSSGLKAYYRIGATGTSTAITLATQTATGAWSSGGFVEIDATNMKGVYRLDVPNAVAATAAMVSIYLYGATNMMAVAQRVDCRAVPVDLKLVAGQTANAAAAVTFPATIASTTNITSASGIVPATGAITNAQAATIPTSGTITTGTNQTGDAYAYLSTNLGLLGANLSGAPKTGFKLASDGLASVTAWTVGITGNITGNLSGSVGSVTSAIVLPSAPTDWITSASVSAAAVTKIQSGLSTYAGADTSGTTTLLTRVTATAAFPTAAQVATIPITGTINTTTPPTVTAIRTEMDTNSAKLANLDATVSSRLATSSYTTPPSVSAIQTGLATSASIAAIPTNPLLTTDARLNNLDAAVSTRLATSGYTAPPSTNDMWSAATRTLTAFAFTPTVGGYSAGQDPATLLLVNGATNKLKVNTDNSVNATATVDVNAVATAVANILYVDGATNKLKVNTDNTVNATVSGTIVNYVTIPSAVAQASIIPLRITMLRGDTLSVQLPAMGTLTGRTKLIFTAKATTSTPDSAALFQITEAGGLVTLLGSSSVTGTGSLVVANATTGLVNITLSATATALIPATTTPYVWDCEVIGPSGTRTPISGTLLALPDVTLQTT
jgi:hypothetical protein